MNFSVPVGSAPAIGRIRPYKGGGPADAEEAWSMYHCDAPLLWEPREESRGLADGLSHLCPLSITSESSHAPSPVLKCCGVVQRQLGVADAMIEAPHTKAQHTKTRIADKGWRVPRDLQKSAMSEKTAMRGW